MFQGHRIKIVFLSLLCCSPLATMPLAQIQSLTKQARNYPHKKRLASSLLAGACIGGFSAWWFVERKGLLANLRAEQRLKLISSAVEDFVKKHPNLATIENVAITGYSLTRAYSGTFDSQYSNISMPKHLTYDFSQSNGAPASTPDIDYPLSLPSALPIKLTSHISLDPAVLTNIKKLLQDFTNYLITALPEYTITPTTEPIDSRNFYTIDSWSLYKFIDIANTLNQLQTESTQPLKAKLTLQAGLYAGSLELLLDLSESIKPVSESYYEISPDCLNCTIRIAAIASKNR